MRRVFVFIIACCLFGRAQAQPANNVWTLQECVQYAIDHNISIKQDSLNARLARYTLTQTQLSQLPSVNANSQYGRSFGRSINPTTNQFVEGDYNYLAAQGQANLLVFGGLQVRNNIAKNRYSLLASIADLEQLRDDVSLNVANQFLIVLLDEGQVHVSENQVSLSKAQLDQTSAFANAGRLPELNVAQLESQLATDSSNLITAIENYNSAILDLKTLMNLDFNTPFSVQVPDMQLEDQQMVLNTTPAEIFQHAVTYFGSIKGSKLRVTSAEKGLAAAKGNLYPQLSIGYQAGTNYASNYQTLSYTPTGLYQIVPVTSDTTSGAYRAFYQSINNPVASDVPFHTQMNTNFRQSVYASINIPIFNGWQSQYAVKQAKINLYTQQLNEYNAELTLKQNVYKAHNNALNSIQKYYSALKAATAAQRALDFAKERYAIGLISTVDLLVTQQQEYSAASNLLGAKYDLIFKLKVIDYYMGKEIKL
jgi:outer membrane protein